MHEFIRKAIGPLLISFPFADGIFAKGRTRTKLLLDNYTATNLVLDSFLCTDKVSQLHFDLIPTKINSAHHTMVVHGGGSLSLIK